MCRSFEQAFMWVRVPAKMPAKEASYQLTFILLIAVKINPCKCSIHLQSTYHNRKHV